LIGWKDWSQKAKPVWIDGFKGFAFGCKGTLKRTQLKRIYNNSTAIGLFQNSLDDVELNGGGSLDKSVEI